MQLFFCASLLACLVSALNLGGNIRLWTDFTPIAPLGPEWTNVLGALAPPFLNGNVVSANSSAPFVMRTVIPFCTSTDFVLQMNARIAYTPVLLSGLVNSIYGWNEDPQYGCAWTGAVSEDGWRFQFIITQAKIYALYAHYPEYGKAAVEAVDERRFAYVIPVQKGAGNEYPTDYSVNMKAGEYDVSYRVNNTEKLIIRNVGQTISNRFLVWSDPNTNIYTQVSFPWAVNMEIGLGSMAAIGPIGVPHTVCQRAVFDLCTQNIMSSPRCFCRYGTIQVGGWDLAQNMTLSNIFVARLYDVVHCNEGGVQNGDCCHGENWWSN